MIERNIARIALPKMLVGLFVAPFADYGEYERWNSNAHTSCFGVRMPQASEVAVSRSRNGQYHFGFPLWIPTLDSCRRSMFGTAHRDSLFVLPLRIVLVEVTGHDRIEHPL